MNKRKIFLIITAFILTAIIAGSIGAVTVLAWPFADVFPGDWYYNDVQWLDTNAITHGCGGAYFCPGNAVSRGEMAAFLHREAGALVAAGVHIQLDGGDNPFVGDWFNNVNGVAPTVAGVMGYYVIDFGFTTANRFPTCTIDLFRVETRNATCSVYNPQFPPTYVDVQIYDPDVGFTQPAEFWVILYGQ
jgi:hypothetical protein